MQITSLTALAVQQLETARTASAGRSAVTVHGGREHDLRQTVIAMTAGTRLGEHESPGEATLQVLEGEVSLHAGEDTHELRGGDHGVIPPVRHDLVARTDAVVLLTVATRA
ncbi:cupin domain-containing protein [Nocardioides sp. zg-1228]|uniref:cupin domain-containing protein n=1 Tax=Nocardioides sp. zg-1228 TaxID=2763008 RepID=UPI0016428175|nr:cupin domain-containing protein [Nocardioides sp. zg-1228]MBC2932807.1 cupin domain-containing protein [Nocardioides sp. zg-1228]QSF58278.1 cupin domain-containing protein [Nocardioides sp. zg-1228]